ncbi:MAG: RsmB/NOP family class I SAM-dependent RNA methyltransferase [Paenibacillaceae bacterium]
MIKQLPEAFLNRMEHLLGTDFTAFLASYDASRIYGLRINTLKARKEAFLELNPFQLSPIPWVEEGFYYEEEDRPGKHPYYHAGLYYIQEPSAMAPVELLQIQPGDRVLDLCAAPGGKSTQIAAKLQHQGLLVSNDNQAERQKVVVKNLALFGVRNAMVTVAEPDALAFSFPQYFNKILIDAPCSGEGMFRKDDSMISSWDTHSVAKCSLMQKAILDAAVLLLKPGGRIVYSTCTFSPEENEATIARFLDGHPEFKVERIDSTYGWASGRSDWIAGEHWLSDESFKPESVEAVEGTVRLWPHLLRGEGHYIAVLSHDREQQPFPNDKLITNPANPVMNNKPNLRKPARVPIGSKETEELGLWFEFMSINLKRPIEGQWVCYGSHVFWTNWDLPDMSRINVARPGWFVGTIKKNRFEPSHALAMGLHREDALRVFDFAVDSEEIIRYLRGETLILSDSQMNKVSERTPSKGYCLITVEGYPVGWGKWLDGMLKNEYPAGWRRT